MAPRSKSKPAKDATRASKDNTETPDGYVMLPHGLGLAKVAQDDSIGASDPNKALTNNSTESSTSTAAGRYFLRRSAVELPVPRPSQSEAPVKPILTPSPVASDAESNQRKTDRYCLRERDTAQAQKQAQGHPGLRTIKLLSKSHRLKAEEVTFDGQISSAAQAPQQRFRAPPNSTTSTALRPTPTKRRRTTKEDKLTESQEDLIDPTEQNLSPDTYEAVKQATVRKRIPVKNQSPYQKKSKVPWGETPWPEHNFPRPSDCEDIAAVLMKAHPNGKLGFMRPEKIPPPSLEVAGCGETQQILDGLCRTVLSGATTMEKANDVIKDVAKAYGTITKSIELDGQQVTLIDKCIDWNNVRLLGQEKLKTTIQSGGLQTIGSKAIIGILEMTYNTNAQRAAAFAQEKATGVPASMLGTVSLTQSQKDMEIWMFENNVISLEHLRGLSPETAMNELVSFPGVGVKTAACVVLFSLQEPCFAVDTHCFRMALWLGWLPKNINENNGREKAFAHLNLRIPDHLKYAMHQLFIVHGQTCHKCKSNTAEGGDKWEDCVCPLEELLDRNKPIKKIIMGSKRKVAELEEDKGGEEAKDKGQHPPGAAA